MAKDAAYRSAEQKIDKARRSGATELDLSQKYGTKDSEKLAELPDSLWELTALQSLSLSGNQLTVLPETIGQLTELQWLYLYDNQLTTLPETIGQLVQLHTLSVWENKLSTLPDSINSLKSLTEIDLADNQFVVFPSLLCDLPSLKIIILGDGSYRGNKITELPVSLLQLINLNKLELDNNPLNPELAAAYEQGLDTVKAYLRAKAEDQIVLNEAKLILVGEGGVGKTSLLAALRGEPFVEKRETTHGVEVNIKSLAVSAPDNDAEITLNGWDFGGQNIYRHTHQLFFTAPAVYLAVWEPRRGPEQSCVEEWIKMIKHRAYDESRPEERPRILVVATHGGPTERLDHIDEQALRDEFGDLIAGCPPHRL